MKKNEIKCPMLYMIKILEKRIWINTNLKKGGAPQIVKKEPQILRT